MKRSNTGVVVILLAICIIAIALGYVGSRNYESNTTFVNVDTSSAGIIIPQYLITGEVNDTLLRIGQEYPDSVIFADSEVTLYGSETVNVFKQSISDNNINFDMGSVYSFYNLDASTIVANSYIVYSPAVSYNSITISYDELERILNGDNETISYYRELLNNSPSNMYPEGNVSAAMVVDGYVSSYVPDETNNVVVVSISSTGV